MKLHSRKIKSLMKVTVFLCLAGFAFLGCDLFKDDADPCTDGEYQCGMDDALQSCEDGVWQDYTYCPAVNQVCGLIEGLAQCVEVSADSDDSDDSTNTDDGDDSESSQQTETTDDDTDSATEDPVNTDETTDTDTPTEASSDIDSETDTGTGTGEVDSATVFERDTNGIPCEKTIRLGVLGSPNSTANGADIGTFLDWLNTKSDLQISTVGTRTPIDAAFLANYDVLLLLLQADQSTSEWWEYDATESAALAAWINAGGGLITTIGYTASAQEETNATNSLLSESTGLMYAALSDTFSSCDYAECQCWGQAASIENWTAEHPVAQNVTYIGALHGFSIVVPAEGAEIIATDEAGDAAIASVASGAGRVVAIGDEWPLFANMWLPTEPQGEPDVYSPCYDTDSQTVTTAADHFQLPQFWYNVFNWVAPQGSCMTLDDPAVTP